MEIRGIQNTLSFGRAFTTKEKEQWKKTEQEARKELGLGMTTATVFDFSVPKAKNDTGIGTSFSEDAQQLAGFLKTMCGVNTIQLQPQGEVSNLVRSPYSGSSFSLGMHLIDLNKLQEESYGKLLDEDDMKLPYMTKNPKQETVDYNGVFSDDGQKAMLKRAYIKFSQLDKSSPLKKEFASFKKENSYWLERDALYEAAAVDNNSRDMKTWSDRDQNVFATKEGNLKRIAELKKVKDNQSINVVDFEEFVQFIADKQQKEAKANFNNQGIELMGDAQIGFSQKDVWAHKSAFYPTYEFGCDIGEGKYTCWSPAINFDKLNGEAGELLYNKFDRYFKRYDGIRIDAAWQFVKPLICDPMHKDGKEVFDSNGNKLGHRINNQPVVSDGGKYILKNIILKAADENNIPHNKIFLELLGGNSYESLDNAKSLGLPLIHITRYGDENWGNVRYYESRGDNKYQNMRPGEYMIGPGTHDDHTLLEQVEEGKGRAGYLARELHLNEHDLRHNSKELSSAVFAELFTTKHQFATLPDILGSRRRINTPNTTEGNWSYRATQEYEKEYFKNLANGQGLNTPDALSKALRAKNHGHNSTLVRKLEHFADILRQRGPMTTEAADKEYA